MQTLDLKGLKELVRNIILGKKTPNLVVTIKDNETGEESPLGSQPGGAAERRSATDGKEKVIHSPAQRLIKPSSRSPFDIWTVIYNNQVVAKGKFEELKKVLADIPRQIFSMPKIITKQIVSWAGFIALMAACFFAGMRMNGPTETKTVITEARENPNAEAYRSEAAELRDALRESLERLEVLTSIASTNLAMQQAKPAETHREEPAEDFSKKLKEMELRQLIDLEQKRTALILKDEELNGQGFTEFHIQRRSIAASVETLNKKI